MTYTCQRCGYVWTGRRPDLNRPKPVACPNCLSRKWDRPRKE